jgi:hypothetical protein
MRTAVARHVEELRQLDLVAIKQLPSFTELIPPTTVNTLYQYHDVAGDLHFVVVQASKDRWFGLFTAMEVAGFVIDENGIRRPITEAERWNYI